MDSAAESDVYLPNKGDAGKIKIDGRISIDSKIGISVIPDANAKDGDVYWFTSGFGDNPLTAFFADEVSAEKGYSIHLDDGANDGNWEACAVVDKAAGGDSKELTANKNTGALTVKKGIKKGQYKVRIKVTDTVTELIRTVTVKIKVK